MEWSIDRGNSSSNLGKRKKENSDAKPISADAIQYFLQAKKLIEQLEEKNDRDDEMEILKERVFNEIAGKEVAFMCNTVSSKVLEKIIYYITNEQLISFFINIGENIVMISKNEFGSHVLQVILNRIAPLVHQSPPHKEMDKMIELFQKLVDACPDLYSNLYSNFVMRSLICLLSNIYIVDSRKSNKYDKHDKIELDEYYSILVEKYEKNKSLSKMLRQLYIIFKKSTSASDLFFDQKLGIIFVYLILGIHNYNDKLFKKAFNRFYKRVIQFISENPNKWVSIVNGNFTPVFILQIICKYSNENQLAEVYEIVRVNFDALYTDKIAVNLIKTILVSTKTNEMAILITTKITETIRKLSIKEKDLLILSFIVSHLSKLICLSTVVMDQIFGCFKNKTEDNLFKYVITFGCKCTIIESNSISGYASGLLTHVFSHIDYSPLTEGLMGLELSEILSVASHPSGSRVIDSFFLSSYVSDSSKKQFCNSFTNEMIISLSKDKYGSFCMENIWKFFEKSRKITLSKLMLEMTHFKYNYLGKMLSAKLNLPSYCENTYKSCKRTRN